MSNTISVMVCVNNPDNGNYAGRIAGMHVDDFMQLEPRVLPEPRCTLKNGTFSVHRKRVCIYGHQQWVGNWCWDAITLAPPDLAELFAHLFGQKCGEHRVWGIDQAEGDAAIALMDRLNRDDEPTAAEWLAAMRASLSEGGKA